MPIFSLKTEYLESKLPKKILFIHIPKTGGTSVQQYLSQYYDVRMLSTIENYGELYGKIDRSIFKTKRPSPQHRTYQEILSHRELILHHYGFDVLGDDVLTFSIVRNPYRRIISELFYNKQTRRDAIRRKRYKLGVGNLVINMINKTVENYCANDGHLMPQCAFLLCSNMNYYKRINICNTESLEEDLHSLGFTDYQTSSTVKRKKGYSLKTLLDADSIECINTFYKSDFRFFKYKKIQH
jgi:hypothetical protein